MMIDLSPLIDGTEQQINLNEEVDLLALNFHGNKIEFNKPISISGDIYKAENELVIHANISYQYKDSCSRCLKPITVEEQTVLSGSLLRKSENQQTQDTEDDGMIIYYDRARVDLREPIIKSIILSLPMRSLCDEMCKGFCSKCGKNLNEAQCNCAHDDVDPRLAKLKELFDSDKEVE